MAKTTTAGKKSPAPAKRTAPLRKKAASRAAPTREVGERESVSGMSTPKAGNKAGIDRRYFGSPRPGATHILLTKHSANGSAERCFVNRNGVAEEKLPVAFASVDKLRKLWGPGTYRGQWLGLEQGKWKALGRTAEVRILAQMPDESIARASSRAVGDVVAIDDGGDVPAHRALAVREPDEVIDLRVRAEREIAKMRLDAEREISEVRLNSRLEELRAENAQALRRLEARIDAGHGDDDDDEEPSPWAWVMPLLEKFRPTIEELIPKLLAQAMQKTG